MTDAALARAYARTRSSPAVAAPEAAYSQAIVDAAEGWGWLVFRVHDSRRSPAGWPDLAMTRGDRLILAELKVGDARLRPEQKQWLAALERLGPPVEVKIWRMPGAWDDIIRTLAPEGALLAGDELALPGARGIL